MDDLMRFDPTDGSENPYPSHAGQYRAWHGQTAWLFNPFTGDARNAKDIGSDCFGYLLCGTNAPLESDAQSSHGLIGAGAVLGDTKECAEDANETLIRQLIGRAEFLRKKGDQKSSPLMSRAAYVIRLLTTP